MSNHGDTETRSFKFFSQYPRGSNKKFAIISRATEVATTNSQAVTPTYETSI